MVRWMSAAVKEVKEPAVTETEVIAPVKAENATNVSKKVRLKDRHLPVHQKDKKVTISNKFNHSAYTLGLTEKRLVNFALTKLIKDMVVTDRTAITINAAEFNATFSLTDRPSHAYRELARAGRALKRRVIKLYESRDAMLTDQLNKDVVSYKEVDWISQVDYEPKQGQITIFFSNRVIPLISQLNNGNFSQFLLRGTVGMSTFYSIRLYEILMQFARFGKRQFSLDELRTLLDIEPHQYPRWQSFKERVLNPAVIDINLNSDYTVRNEHSKKKTDDYYIAIKDLDGKTVIGVLFYFWKKIDSETEVSEPAKLDDSTDDEQGAENDAVSGSDTESHPVNTGKSVALSQSEAVKGIANAEASLNNYPHLTVSDRIAFMKLSLESCGGDGVSVSVGYVVKYAADNSMSFVEAVELIGREFRTADTFSLELTN
jgi:plasmid replication initiation protein